MLSRPFAVTCNTDPGVKARNAEINSKRDVKRFSTLPQREGGVVIVGGGPSLTETIDQLREYKESGCEVWATNNTFAFLVSHGIPPEAHVLLDARIDNLSFIHPTAGVTYYLNISCAPEAFELLAGNNVIMYDLSSAGTGTTVGMKALYLAGFSGFREFHLFGFDSSYREGTHHAYAQALNDGEEVHEVTVDGRAFKASGWMIYQAEEFHQIARSFADQDCIITVAGDGLLPWVASRMSRNFRVLTAIYDLAYCPPTYDFISFLANAEARRIEIGAEAMDVVFMPGPIDGFRDDLLPDGHDYRIGTLFRVCVAACRLVKSVRNVEILKARRKIEAEDVYPIEYMDDPATHKYGAIFFPDAFPMLEATESARSFARKVTKGKRYVTITLRQSSNWPQRNSNVGAWIKARSHMERMGFQVVWISDVESPEANAFSWDVDLRLALYEDAEMNLGVNNGPMTTLLYSNAKYMMFKMVTDGIPWCMPEYLEKCGIPDGPSQSGRGQIFWCEDTSDRICEEFDLRMGIEPTTLRRQHGR